MLTVTIPGFELFDSQKNEFITIPDQELTLEHSLLSISKWEAKWKKSFIDTHDKTNEETIDYIRCMTINKVNPYIYTSIPNSVISKIAKYIEDPMTATKITKNDGKGKKKSGKVITSEEIYWQMIMFNIPFECEKWHLNRLFTLIRVCDAKNNSNNKMSKAETLQYQKNLNEARRKAYESKRNQS